MDIKYRKRVVSFFVQVKKLKINICIKKTSFYYFLYIFKSNSYTFLYMYLRPSRSFYIQCLHRDKVRLNLHSNQFSKVPIFARYLSISLELFFMTFSDLAVHIYGWVWVIILGFQSVFCKK